MKLGIITPVVNMNPRFSPPRWEQDGGMDDVVAVSKAAEELGYDWVTCSEHVAIPADVAKVRGARYWDPVVVLSYVASSTKSIGLLPYVLVLGYHHPLETVKRYGSLDEASGGRLVLGVGVGSLKPEFELLGAAWSDRGARADEAIEAIRSSFGVREPAFSGHHYRFAHVVVEPCGLPRRLKVWVGGRTRRSLRRALELGDGWIPFGLDIEGLGTILEDGELAERMADTGEDFELVLAPEPPLDAISRPDVARATLTSYAKLGASGLNLRFRHESRDHYIEQMAATRALALEALGE